jgi:hypothetical protein
MPEPSAPAPVTTNPAITYTDDYLKDLHKSVAGSLQQAGVNVPYEAVKPIHVPDARPTSYIDQNQINIDKSVPESFASTPQTPLSPLSALSEHLDYADQIVTGRTHVMGEAQRFTKQKEEKEQKRMEFANMPKTDSRTPVKKFVDWLHQ